MNSLIAKIEALAAKYGTDIHSMWEAFELFVEKELGIANATPANDQPQSPTPSVPPTE